MDDSTKNIGSRDPVAAFAEGTIVSHFPGGLTAIKLNDDISVSTGNLRSSTTDVRSILTSQSSSLPLRPPLSSETVSSSASGDLVGKKVTFPDGTQGCVVVHRPPVVFAYSHISPDSRADGLVKIIDDEVVVQVLPDEIAVDCLETISTDSKLASRSTAMERAVFAPIPKLSDIALINNPMLTGTTMIDALAPIGQGQNMLLIGENLTDMRGYALDFLRTQLRDGKRTKCVYASSQRSRDEVQQQLKAWEVDHDVVVVAPTELDLSHRDDASKAAQTVLMAGAACAIGEAFALEQEMNTLVIVDTIDLYKQLWDTTTRVLVDVYGADAVVKGEMDGGASSEMRAFYSSLIQRAAQFKASLGGGSLTLLLLVTIPPADDNDDQVFDVREFEHASEKVKDRVNLLIRRNIPLTAATLRKINIPAPSDGARRHALQHIDELISMSDGQIWLDDSLVVQGQSPPMDPQRSLTRIGIGADTASRADAPALRRIADRLRLDLSQASNLEGADATVATTKQIRRRNALLLAMYQPSGRGGRRLSESCVALLAAQEGFLDVMASGAAAPGTEEGETLIQDLLDHVLREAASSMQEIDTSLDVTPSSREALTAAIASFFRRV